MAEGEQIRVDFSKTKGAAQRLLDETEALIVQARALGDEYAVARLEARRIGLAGPSGGRSITQIQDDSAALSRENTLRREAAVEERATLDVMRAETQQRLEQAAILGRMKAAMSQVGPIVVPPGSRAVGSKAATAGGLSTAEWASVSGERALLNQQGAAQGAGAGQARAAYEAEQQRNVAIREGLALDKARTEEALKQAEARKAAAVNPPQSTTGFGVAAGAFTAEENALVNLDTQLRAYDVLAREAGVETNALASNMTRLALVQAGASDQMRKHGALTTEFLGALARGETTVGEFGYQMGATISKFAGWTAAAAATYGALGAVVEIGKGAIDSSNGVGQLNRTISQLDTQKAAQAIRDLSAGTAVPVKEAADAMFQFSRTFHNVDEAAGAAKLGLGAFTLDQVKMADSVRLATLVHQQYGLGISGLTGVFNLLSSAQREYNTRLSEMIPLVSTSIGAVRNSGGDLTQLIQLGTVLQRSTGLAGTRVGTGIYRAASNFAPANAVALEQRGLPDPTKNFTQFLIDAVHLGAQLKTDSARTDLSKEIFGKQYGGRFASLFTPQSAQTLDKITGPGKEGLTPGATQGAFQKELNIQLQTTRKELDQFVYGLQRLGSALATSGILAGFGVLLRGVDGLVNGLTHLAEAFGGLPSEVRTLVEALLIFKAASAFLTGSRLGASVGALPGLRTITQTVPGLAPNPSKVRDQELAAGTRASIGVYDDLITRTTATMAGVSAKQNVLNAKAQSLLVASEKEGLTVDARNKILAERAAILREAIALGAKNNELETELNAQQTVRMSQSRQLTGLTARRPSQQLSEGEKAALADSMGFEAATATTAAGEATLGQLAAQKTAAAKKELALRFGREATATAEAGLATVGATTAAQAARNTMTGLTTRLGDMVAAIDPLTAGLILVPVAMGLIQSAVKSADDATAQAAAAMKLPTSNLDQLATRAQALQAAAKKQDSTNVDHSILPGFLGDAENYALRSAQKLLPGVLGKYQNVKPTQKAAAQDPGYLTVYQDLVQQAIDDGKHIRSGELGREAWYYQLTQLKGVAAQFEKTHGGSEGPGALKAFYNSLQSAYARIQGGLNSSVQGRGDPFKQFEQGNAKQLEQQLQSLDDFSKVYGTNNNALKKAAYGYTYLANKFAKPGAAQADLQAVTTAQTNFINMVNKNVQDKLKAAESAQSYGAESGDLGAAMGVIEHAKQVERQALDAIIKKDKGNAEAIKRAKAAADIIFSQLNDQLKTVLDQQIQLIAAQSALAVSDIGGISPEADIQRAQQALQGLQQELAKARAEHASWLTIAGLQTSLNNAAQALLKQQIANADTVAQARGQLAVAQITGIGPAADLARARQTVANAQGQLARDQANGAGQAKVLTDQAAVDDAMRSLNQQIQTRNQQLHQQLAAYIQSQTALQQSQTLDPIKQAQEQVIADAKVLATIQRQDYQTEQEYLTARNNQRAKANTDRTHLNDQIIQTDLSTLAFEAHTQKIGDQQYINSLEQILRTKKLTLTERQSLMSQIYDLQQGLGKTLDLNVGSIKLPSVYQIRRAIGLGQRGELPGAQNTVINHTASVVVYVNGVPGARAVGRVLDEHLNTTVRAAMRAKGVI